ncbi:MAG: Hsp20/alpha crystallin family protein [Desulforhopalus sp.]
MWSRMNDIDRMFSAMDSFRSKMNRMFTDFDKTYGGDLNWRIANGSPMTNLYDNGDRFEVISEVPGLSKDDLNIRIQGTYLEISGTRRSEVPEGYKVHRMEREPAAFSRSFTLPSEVDVDNIEAVLKNGLLILILPKAEAVKAKQIAIS